MESTAAVLEEPAASNEFAEERPAKLESIEVAALTGDEVVVEVAAASLCHTDVSIALGNLEESYPLVMGHEGAGVVHSVGPDVESLEPDDHIVFGRIACGRCQYCRVGHSNLCEKRTEARKEGTLQTGAVRFSRDGEPIHHCHGVSSFSEYTLVTEDVAIGITDEVPFEQATLLGCGVFTGAGAVMNTADVEAGSTVVVFGAGGVGMSAIQAAAARSAIEIITVDIVEEKFEFAKEQGATATINSAEVDPVEALDERVDEVDYTIDTVGHPEVTAQAVDSLSPKGTAVIVGVPPVGKQDLSVNLHDVIVQEKSVLGSFNGSYNLADAIPRLAEMTAAGKFDLEVLISETRPLSEINEAIADLESGGVLRQVLVP